MLHRHRRLSFLHGLWTFPVTDSSTNAMVRVHMAGERNFRFKGWLTENSDRTNLDQKLLLVAICARRRAGGVPHLGALTLAV